MINFQICSKSIEVNVIQIQNRSMSDPPLPDNDFKNKMASVWTTLNIMFSASGYTNRSTAGSVNKPCDRIRCERRADVRSHFDG